MSISIIAIVFGTILIAELPDKSMIASLALSTRFRRFDVWCGAAAAFLIHVIIAITAGHFITLLPHKLLETLIGLLFICGAGLLLFRADKKPRTTRQRSQESSHRASEGFTKAFMTSFVIVFVGEWGDITQIATANYAAHYQASLSVGIGATAALWSAAALAVLLGATLLNRIPDHIIRRLMAFVLLLFATVSLTSALK